jgi:hypothetical protein
MRNWLAAMIVLMPLAGCGPELSQQDLGHVVFELPKVADTDKPYPMPQLGPPVEWKQDPFNRPLP